MHNDPSIQDLQTVYLFHASSRHGGKYHGGMTIISASIIGVVFSLLLIRIVRLHTARRPRRHFYSYAYPWDNFFFQQRPVFPFRCLGLYSIPSPCEKYLSPELSRWALWLTNVISNHRFHCNARDGRLADADAMRLQLPISPLSRRENTCTKVSPWHMAG